MPDSTHSIIETVIAGGVALLALLGFRLRERKIIDEEFDLLHQRVNKIDGSLHEFKEDVGKNYPSRPTMREEIQALERNINTQLQAHASDLKLIIQKEINRAIKR